MKIIEITIAFLGLTALFCMFVGTAIALLVGGAILSAKIFFASALILIFCFLVAEIAE